MARKKHEAEKKHALRKKEAPPVQDMPDETEHPALSEKKKPRVSKLLYRIIAALLIAVVLLIILENKDNLTPENIGNWIRTKAVGFGFGDGYPAELTGSTALAGNFGAADGNSLGLLAELDAIAAVALGGTSMSGGRGKIVGTIAGVLIIAVLNNGLNILGVSTYYQEVIKAVVILVAVLSDRKR